MKEIQGDTQANNPDKAQDGLQKLQKALRDNNRVDQMNRESQGFSISKIDNQTLNQLDQYTSLAPATDDKTGLPAVQIQCNNGYTIQYKDPSTGKMVYTSSLNLQSDTTSIKSKGMLKSIADNTKRDGPTNGGLFSIMSKDGTREKFTIMDNASADRAREAEMHQKVNEKQNDKFTLNDISKDTHEQLTRFTDIQSTSKGMILHLKPNTILEYSVGGSNPVRVQPGDLNQAMIPNSTTTFKTTFVEKELNGWSKFQSVDKDGSVTQVRIRSTKSY